MSPGVHYITLGVGGCARAQAGRADSNQFGSTVSEGKGGPGNKAQTQYLTLSRLSISTLFIAALNAASRLLADLLDQKGCLAGWTGFIDGAIP
jgi:hypothetical protein